MTPVGRATSSTTQRALRRNSGDRYGVMPPVVVEVAIRGGRPLIARNSAPVLLADLIGDVQRAVAVVLYLMTTTLKK